MVSIIIPTYNEEKNITGLLGSFSDRFPDGDYELIVVDGGSDDGTVEKAAGFPVEIIRCGRGRALQLNRGAEAARGEILFFLHADCMLEDGSLEAVERAVAGGSVGGGLSQKLPPGRLVYRSIEASGNIRAGLFKIFYGDQAIFARRDVFFDIGGFDEVDLLEDVMFSIKLAKAGKVVLLDKKVYASPRRWEAQGIAKASLINWAVTAGFMLRISPGILKKIYRDIR